MLGYFLFEQRAKCMEGKMYGGQNEWRAKRQRAKCMVGKMYGGQNEWWAKCKRAKCMVDKMYGGQNESGQNVVAPKFGNPHP